MADLPLDGMTEIVLHRVHVPLVEPFVAAHGTETERQVVLVEAVGDDGVSGWGECSALSRPTYTPEYTDGAWQELRDHLVPLIWAAAPPERVAEARRASPMAWTGLAGALTDLRLRRLGRPLAAAIGGCRTDVAATTVLGRRDGIDDLLAAVATRVHEGYRSVKLKIAPGADIEPLAAVRGSFGDLAVAADANGCYRFDDPDHRAALRRLDELGLAYVEQPLPVDDERGLVELAGSWSTSVALDESIGTAADVDRFAATGTPFVLNLKPARVGGLDQALACLASASAAGWPVFVGGMLETGIGRALALAAASWEACGLPTDLGPSVRYFAEDVTEPIELLPGGRLPVPSGPGLGVAPIPERLDRFTVARVPVRA